LSRRTANSKHYIRYKIKGINRCSFLLYWFWHKSHYENVPFEIPGNWCWTTINDIAFVTKLAGFEYTKYIADNISKNDGIPLFKGKNVLNGEVVYEFESYIPRHISDELFRSQISKKCLLTPYVGTIGNIGIHNKEGIYHLGSNVGKIELFNGLCVNVYEEYVKFYLLSSYGYKELTKQKKATAQESISIEAIREVLIPLPPVAEQLRIVNEIDNKLSYIKEISKDCGKISELIGVAKSKIIELAISGKLVPQDPNDEPAIELLKRINPGFKPCDNSHYGNLPPGWAVCRLEDVCQICDNQRQPINSTERQERKKRAQTLYPYYGATGQVDWIDDYMLDGTFILLGEDGAPFLEKFADKAYVVSGKIWVNNHAHILKPNCDITYLTYYLNRYDYSKCVNGSTRLKLTQADMKNMTIVLPPLVEQHRIAGRIENIFRMLDAITAEL